MQSLKQIGDSPEGGAVIYLKNQEGRGIGLFNKIEAYALQDCGQDTLQANLTLGFKPDERHYQDAAKVLHKKGIRSIKLLTNNPHKVTELQSFGILIEDRVRIEGEVHDENRDYLITKRERFHHQLGNL
jgi:3,4-dihydroxy 2-butanone 4-phosphate synthase/GTP cyclohydrolase II